VNGRLLDEATTLAFGAGGLMAVMCMKRKISKTLLDDAKQRLRRALNLLERI
jgi:hypothetical protein